MSAALLTARIVGLMFLPLTALVVPTLIVRPLLPRDLSTAWPLVALALAVTAVAFVATKTHKLTGSGQGRCSWRWRLSARRSSGCSCCCSGR